MEFKWLSFSVYEIHKIIIHIRFESYLYLINATSNNKEIKNGFWVMYMEASEPKWVNPVLNIIVVNSHRIGGLYIYTLRNIDKKCSIYKHVSIIKAYYFKGNILIITNLSFLSLRIVDLYFNIVLKELLLFKWFIFENW